MAPGAVSAPMLNATTTTTVFNLSISLEEDPQGDDEYPADPGASDAAQNKFEKKIEEFADAVFQMSNGKLKVGDVTMFRDGAQANNADVQWKENCSSGQGPRANPSGFGVPGKRVYFCTNWTGAPSLMDTPKGAGFTLAHEWGHYALGVYDEYIANCGQVPETNCPIWLPRSTDTASSPSIMNNQWNAVSGSQDWLEFSTNGVEPYASDTDGNDENAHARTFEENAWATLTRSPTTDPRYGFLPTRTQYTALVAPSGSDLTVNDDESTARSELDIIWAGNQVVELMLDTSGSMAGTPLANAQTAGSLLVGQLAPGENAVGVGQFNTAVSQMYPITDIPDPDTGIRTAAQAAITGLVSTGVTAMYDGATLALSETQSFQGGTRPSVVFLLSDGGDNSSTETESSVIAAYQAAKVPLITFGFGSASPTGTLQNLASGTGGQYFFSPTTLAQIQQAFVAANAAVSSSVVVASATAASPASDMEVRPLQLDGTLDTASVNVSYALPQADIALRLLGPNGADTGLIFACEASSEVSCSVDVDVAALGTGEYGVEITNSAATDKDVAVLVSGVPSTFENYDVAVEFNNSNYPASFAIEATVTKGAALTGLDVTALVTKPDSTTMTLTLLDDGMNSDMQADDGVYTADVPYDSSFTANGTYTAVVTADNSAGNAQTTFAGVAISVDENGNPVTPVPQSATENFTRVGVSSATLANATTDDHSNFVTVPSFCTSIADDNTDTDGRIDYAADIDCFYVTPSSTASDMVVRATSLRSDMEPVIRVYDPTGTSQILSANLATSENAASGVVVTVPAGSLDASGHVVTVEHQDATADSGGYAVSVGSALSSDADGSGGGGGDDGGDDGGVSGGAFGPLSAIFAALLAWVGLRQRRYAN